MSSHPIDFFSMCKSHSIDSIFNSDGENLCKCFELFLGAHTSQFSKNFLMISVKVLILPLDIFFESNI